MINYNKDDKWLITVDLDGTLLNSPTHDNQTNSDVSEKNIEVINKLIDLGHKVAIVTGRPWKETKEIYESIGLKSIIANYNGALIHYPNRESDFAPLRYSINKKILNNIVTDPILEGITTSTIIQTDEQVYVNDMSSELAKTIVADRGLEIIDYNVGDDIKGAVISALIGIDLTKIEDYNQIIQVFKRKYGAAMFFRFWDFKHREQEWLMFEINQKTSNKGTAMKHIAEYYNIPLSRTIAFGDGMNDKEMLIDAAVGVAMKNAKGTVKSYADDTTDYTNDEGGVGRYLEEFFDL